MCVVSCCPARTFDGRRASHAVRGLGIDTRQCPPTFQNNPVVPQELERAYLSFLDRRRTDQCHDDTISIVQFNNGARVVCQAVAIDCAPKTLSMKGGGTSFAGAMATAAQVLRSSNASRQATVVFMSDGAAYDVNKASLIMAQMLNEHPDIRVEVVAFGSGADTTALGLIANAGGGTMTNAGAGGLSHASETIASSASNASEELYDEICKRIAEEVSTQLMLEYL